MCNSMAPDPESSSDDVWADEDDEHIPAAAGQQDALERERNALEQRFYNAGYREGLDEGTQQSLQEGFNIGFRQGAVSGYEWGALKASVKTLSILCGQVPGTSAWTSKVSELSSHVDGIKDRAAMLGCLKEIISQQLSADDVPETVKDDPELDAAFQRLIQEPAEAPPSNIATPDMTKERAHVRQVLQELGLHSLV